MVVFLYKTFFGSIMVNVDVAVMQMSDLVSFNPDGTSIEMIGQFRAFISLIIAIVFLFIFRLIPTPNKPSMMTD